MIETIPIASYCIAVVLFTAASLLAVFLAEKYLEKAVQNNAGPDTPPEQAEQTARQLQPPLFSTHKKRLAGCTVLGVLTGLGAGYTIGLGGSLLLMAAAYVCMATGALIDQKLRIIPNGIPLCMVTMSGVHLLVMFLLAPQLGVPFAMSCLLGGGISFLLTLLVSVLSRGGFGMGDVKLLGALGLMCGAFCVTGTLFLGTLSAAVYSVWLLIRRKAGMKSSMPFGPFLLIGYAAAIILGIC